MRWLFQFRFQVAAPAVKFDTSVLRNLFLPGIVIAAIASVHPAEPMDP